MGDDGNRRAGYPLRVWRGEVSLVEAFWGYAIAVGTFVNLLASLLFILANALGAPPLVAIAAFYMPVPYNTFAAIVVWRSAGRYAGPPIYAQLARVLALVWAIVESLI